MYYYFRFPITSHRRITYARFINSISALALSTAHDYGLVFEISRVSSNYTHKFDVVTIIITRGKS